MATTTTRSTLARAAPCVACNPRSPPVRPSVRSMATTRPAPAAQTTTTTTTAPALPPPPAVRLAAAAAVALAAALLVAASPLAAPAHAVASSLSPDDALGSGLLPGDAPSGAPSFSAPAQRQGMGGNQRKAPAPAAGPAPAPAATVPRAYSKLVRALSSAVRDALDADAEGRPERAVRRRADPAGQRVREFVATWRDDPRVAGQPCHEQVEEAIAELGAFYARAGPRAAVTREVRASVVAHLERAEALLPPAEKGLLGF